MLSFRENYFKGFSRLLEDVLACPQVQNALDNCMSLLTQLKINQQTLYVIGNGGSHAIAEHSVTDFTKNAGIRAMSFSNGPMLSAFSNDYGHRNVFVGPIEAYCRENDVLIAISSSGKSENILLACDAARAKGLKIITLSGFACDNLLRSKGDVNIWIPSSAYGYVELAHHLIIHYMNDALIGREVYSAKANINKVHMLVAQPVVDPVKKLEDLIIKTSIIDAELRTVLDEAPAPTFKVPQTK